MLIWLCNRLMDARRPSGAYITTREKGANMADKNNSGNHGKGQDGKGNSKPILTAAEQNELRRDRKKTQNAQARARAHSGEGAPQRTNLHADSMKRHDQKVYQERQLRPRLVKIALEDEAIGKIAVELEGHKSRLGATGLKPGERKYLLRQIKRLDAQLVEIYAAFDTFATKSDFAVNAHTAVRNIKMSNGYLGRIVREALMGAIVANRVNDEANTLVNA